MSFTWDKLKQNKKVKPMGSRSPYVWVIEASHGCNLNCGHCCNELLPKDRYENMSAVTWRNTWEVLNAVSPTVRVDLSGIVGEPTMHPDLVEMLKVARAIAPQAQIQITTNGTMLKAGKVTYRDLLTAGANIVFTDQYGTHEEFERLAEDSGYPWYQYYDKPDGAWSPWTYYGPHPKFIVLMDHPANWPESRYRAGLLGTWYNNMNWERAKRFKMYPVTEAPQRRCNQPFITIPVAANGSYLLCCLDGMQITAGQLGNVNEGVEGFYNYWYGKRMQVIRRHLRNKDRRAIPYACGKCDAIYSRCDLKHWEVDELALYYEAGRWHDLDSPVIDPKNI